MKWDSTSKVPHNAALPHLQCHLLEPTLQSARTMSHSTVSEISTDTAAATAQMRVCTTVATTPRVPFRLSWLWHEPCHNDGDG
jgi:hypothetical protein